MCGGHNHSSPGMKSQGHRSRSRVSVRVSVSKDSDVVGLTEGSLFSLAANAVNSQAS